MGVCLGWLFILITSVDPFQSHDKIPHRASGTSQGFRGSFFQSFNESSEVFFYYLNSFINEITFFSYEYTGISSRAGTLHN